MEKIIIRYYNSPFGEFILGAFNERLCLCDWRYRKMRSSIDQRIQKGLETVFMDGDSHVLEQTIEQLQEYFEGNRTTFDIPIQTVGTDFQQKVWKELQSIPFGATSSYLNLSKKLGNTLAIRAVASANGANAHAIIIPCHRIIGSSGELVGYAGGLQVKKKLLALEGVGIEQLSLF